MYQTQPIGTTKVTLTFAVTSAGIASEVVLTESIIKIGSDARSHVRLVDDVAARMHAVLEVTTPDDLTLIDLGNEPGTYVNGAAVQKCSIRVGDEIRIGRSTLRLTAASVAAVTSPAVATHPALPCLASSAAPPVAQAAEVRQEGFTYRIVKSGPDVAADEVENAAVPAVEVMVLWGDTVLHVAHVAPPRAFWVGDDESLGADCFRIPCEAIGVHRLPLVAVRDGEVYAIVPPGADASIDGVDRGAGATSPRGAEEVRLGSGARARIRINGFTFQVATVAAGRKPAGASSRSRRTAVALWAASLALHAGIVTALTMSPGDALDGDTASLDRSTAAYMLQLQKNAADREIPETPSAALDRPSPDDRAGGNGQRHAGAEGAMGSPASERTGGYYQVRGPAENDEVRIARTRALVESGSYGAIGALASVFGSTANAPIVFDSAYEQTLGRDPNDFNGNLTGDHPGDAFGYGGLAFTGTGPGGGAPWGDGIGLGPVGKYGHGAGTGPGPGWGGGGGRRGTPRKPGTVRPIDGQSEIIGRLPPDSIRRVIRANFPRFRGCYEHGLKRDPGLRGTVGVRFIIDNTGAVESASLSGGSLPDAAVSACVLDVYRSLSFPDPEGGKVMVTYPIDFQNDE